MHNLKKEDEKFINIEIYDELIVALFYSGKFDDLTVKEFRKELRIPKWYNIGGKNGL